MIKFELTDVEVMCILNESQYFRGIVTKELHKRQSIDKVPPTKSECNSIEIPEDEQRMMKFVLALPSSLSRVKCIMALREWIYTNKDSLSYETYQKVEGLVKCKVYVDTLLNVPF